MTRPGPHPQQGPWQGPVTGFCADMLLAVIAMLALMLLAMMGWAAIRAAYLTARPGEDAITAGMLGASGEPGVAALLLMSAVSTGGAALLLYWWRRRATAAETAVSAASALRLRTWAWAGAAGLATYLASAWIAALAQRLGAQPQPTNVAMIEATMASHPTLLLALAVVAAPVYEELLFRRVLFGRLWAAGRPILGLLLSSAAFALMHELPGSGGNSFEATAWLWLIYSAMGGAYAALYWHTRTLWAPIVAHALNNALALGALNLYGAN